MPAPQHSPQGAVWRLVRMLLWLTALQAGIVLYWVIATSFHRPISERLVELPSLRYEFLVDTIGCRIPALDPWDAEMLKSIQKVKPLECEAGRGRPLVASNLTSLFVLEDALVDYNVSNIADIKCCFQPFYRKFVRGHRRNPHADYAIRPSKKRHTFQKEVNVENEEFVRVKCWANNSAIYEDYHAFVPRKAAVEERCTNATFHSQSFEDDAPSVLIVGIDAVSRIRFHRLMTRTAQLLKRMGAIEMLGYNKVGDNTFRNLIPLFTGLSEYELRNSCWPTDDTHFDKCHFVWDDYSDAGYRTGFGEDAATIGIFNYVKRGFSEQPTDYYPRPFFHFIEERNKNKHKKGNACVGSRKMCKVLLQYALKFAITLKNDRSFGVFWGIRLTQDYTNFPSRGDDGHVRFFSALAEAGVLQRSVVALMSDYGLPWGSIRHTNQNQIKVRLPFLFLLFPDWFRERYVAAIANVQRNARRLTTQFDLHETLRDLMSPAMRISQEEVRRRSREVAHASTAPGGPPRGISLFLEVPPTRTCNDAGIVAHWCSCHKSVAVDRSIPIVYRTAHFLVDHINQILSSFRQCAQLTLARIKDMQNIVPWDDLHKDRKDPEFHHYILVVRTKPGDAVFEATIRHIPKTDKLSIVGVVSRLNLHGSQSSCVNNYLIKLYCYCSS